MPDLGIPLPGSDPERRMRIKQAIDELKPVMFSDPQAIHLRPMGMDLISSGKCPLNAQNAMACMFCLYGHMTDCHYPMTCEEAHCSHLERYDVPELVDAEDEYQ